MAGRILVVDDLLPNVRLLEAKLSGEYYDVDTAQSGQAALDILAKGQLPDIVLLDVMMPGMDGFEVCRRIKTDPRTHHVAVVMVTALSDVQDRVRGLEAGADDFLTKPVNDIILFARVRSLVRLKRMIDEWQLREETCMQLGMLGEERLLPFYGGDKARVLVVEDSTINATKLQAILARDSDETTVSDNGHEALSLALATPFELIVVSLGLMGDDPLRLVSHLRSYEQTRQVPVLLLIEDEDVGRLAKGFDIGVNDYLLRPVDANELLARCRTQVRRKRYQEGLKTTYLQSLSLALTDSLTGLYNRRYLDSHLAGMLKRVEGGHDLSLLMIDIDHFKTVNDRFGHPAGDVVLREIAGRIGGNLRGFDLVARYGGEEFVAVMPDCTQDVALSVAERLRSRICDVPVERVGSDGGLTVSVSIGIATSHGFDTPESLLRRADEALYRAKNEGRNRVVAAPDP